jgi:hypothetical protein
MKRGAFDAGSVGFGAPEESKPSFSGAVRLPGSPVIQAIVV